MNPQITSVQWSRPRLSLDCPHLTEFRRGRTLVSEAWVPSWTGRPFPSGSRWGSVTAEQDHLRDSSLTKPATTLLPLLVTYNTSVHSLPCLFNPHQPLPISPTLCLMSREIQRCPGDRGNCFPVMVGQLWQYLKSFNFQSEASLTWPPSQTRAMM